MKRHLLYLVSTACLAAALAPAARAQVTPPAAPFALKVQQGTNVQVLSDGGTVNFAADGIGLNSDATVSVMYTNTATNATANINSVTLTGSTDFTVSGLATFPITLTPLSPNTGLSVRYLPTISKAQSGKITFSYTQGTVNGTFSLNLAGTAPEFVYSFTPQPNGNNTQLNMGDTILVPATNISETASTLIIIANRGSGQGVVNAVGLSGDPDFALAGVPFVPATVDAGKDFRFRVLFSPSDLPDVAAAVRVDFVAGRNLVFNLTGSGKGAVFAYDLVQASGVAAVLPNQTLTLPDAQVGDKSQVVLRVRNTGNADGSIAAISVTGKDYSLTEVPFTPATLTAGSSLTFTINFTPSQPGQALAKLRVGNDSFNLQANGLGATLAYAYVSGSATFQLQSGASVVFTPAAVGQSSSVRFQVTNNGTAPSAIGSISTTGPNTTTFTLTDLPTLPVTLQPGDTVQFGVSFAPLTMGSISGGIRIDNQTYTLTGVGNPPAALPSYSFQGASGTVDPQQQPAVGLSLNADYPLDITGTLTLAFNSEVFANDPAVQFATGGRTLAFTIPANTRQAVFANKATQIRVQTGTVAGSLLFTPSFATASGIDLTPTNPATVALTVPQQAPKLLNVVVSAKTTNGFTLLISGYATGRSITQMDFTFTPTPNETVSTSKLTLNVDSNFMAWYSSSASQPYGSLFTATVPFTLQGDVNKVTNVVDTVQSISVTISNRQGVSAAQSVSLK